MVDYLVKRDLVVLGFESKMRKGEKLLVKELESDMPTGKQSKIAIRLLCQVQLHSKGISGLISSSAARV